MNKLEQQQEKLSQRSREYREAFDNAETREQKIKALQAIKELSIEQRNLVLQMFQGFRG